MNPPKKKKILFLYTELAEYFLSCVRKLKEVGDCEIYIVRWPIKQSEAPFDFNIPLGINIFQKRHLDEEELEMFCRDVDPDVIYCSGWMDKDYVRICRAFKGKIPIVLGIDNKWEGKLRQWAAIAISRLTIVKYFSHCWVPGNTQFEYALRLGFKKENVLTGLYSADFDHYHNQYLKYRDAKQKQFPKRFLYVGRYHNSKGINDLWQAFIQLQEETPNGWELWCLGIGDIKPVEHPKIKHFGFIQPGEVDRFIESTSVFVLPSHFEPWGVVVHEYAAAGFPIVCSNKVGAVEVFLEDGKNGYVYQSGNVAELKKVLRNVVDKSNEELLKMGESSIEKARQNSPRIWSDKLISLIPKKK